LGRAAGFGARLIYAALFEFASFALRFLLHAALLTCGHRGSPV
jgi:hypothetical protein